MSQLRLTIELFEYWHAGSGTGRGAEVDAEPVKTPEGLPYLPGRTLRGLLREAMQTAEESGLGSIEAGTTSRLFGEPVLPAQLATGDAGRLHVSNALPEPEIVSWLQGHPDASGLAQTLFRTLSSTAVDQETGTAAEGTLRSIEVAVPMTLYGTVESDTSEEEWLGAVKACLPLIRGLGSNRRRGLGRVQVTAGGAR